jgi:hypothetical protein
VLSAIGAVVAFCPFWRQKDANLLVVPDRDDLDAPLLASSPMLTCSLTRSCPSSDYYADTMRYPVCGSIWRKRNSGSLRPWYIDPQK